jgi:hypothetical protein
MTKKKPDRFERMVGKHTRSDEDVGYVAFLFPTDAIKLLRKEHRWMVRMIEQKLPETWSMKAPDAYVNGYQHALAVILDRLTKRAA